MRARPLRLLSRIGKLGPPFKRDRVARLRAVEAQTGDASADAEVEHQEALKKRPGGPQGATRPMVLAQRSNPAGKEDRPTDVRTSNG